MEDFEDIAYDAVEAFFLRQLSPGTRPLAPGFVSSVDSMWMATGAMARNITLQGKGQNISVFQMVNDGRDRREPFTEVPREQCAPLPPFSACP
jgi:phosphatidylserine decarboxylase